MENNQARDLFQLQSELVDTKVSMAVSQANDRVIEQINDLRQDIHALTNKMHVEIHGLTNKMHVEINGLRGDMDKQFSSLGHRVTAVEATLSFIKDTQREISSRFVEYVFRAGWFFLAAAALFIASHFVGLIK